MLLHPKHEDPYSVPAVRTTQVHHQNSQTYTPVMTTGYQPAPAWVLMKWQSQTVTVSTCTLAPLNWSNRTSVHILKSTEMSFQCSFGKDCITVNVARNNEKLRTDQLTDWVADWGSEGGSVHCSCESVSEVISGKYCTKYSKLVRHRNTY